jgi:hypothetical protein
VERWHSRRGNKHHITLTEQIEATLAAISAVNLELLARRQLD